MRQLLRKGGMLICLLECFSVCISPFAYVSLLTSISKKFSGTPYISSTSCWHFCNQDSIPHCGRTCLQTRLKEVKAANHLLFLVREMTISGHSFVAFLSGNSGSIHALPVLYVTSI